jgi:hypothetical protein
MLAAVRARLQARSGGYRPLSLPVIAQPVWRGRSTPAGRDNAVYGKPLRVRQVRHARGFPARGDVVSSTEVDEVVLGQLAGGDAASTISLPPFQLMTAPAALSAIARLSKGTLP